MAIEKEDGRSWILLPGTLCTGAVFDPFLDALGVPNRARHVIDLDSPQVGDYLARIAALSDGKAVICGFSLGAIVAAHLVDKIAASECLFFGLNPRADDPAKRQGRLDLAADVDRIGGAAALASRLGTLAGPDPHGGRARILAMAEGAARVAAALEEHPKVARLIYPGLPSHPQAALAARQMETGGTMLAFEVEGGKAAAFRVLNALQVAVISNNLGDARTIATHPATTTHQRLTPDARASLGIGDGLIRLSVGLEDPEDLIADLIAALD